MLWIFNREGTGAYFLFEKITLAFVFKMESVGVPVVAQWLTNPTRNREVTSSIPGLAQGVKDLALAVSCGVAQRRSSHLMWLWLWRKQAAVVPIGLLAWEPPYAMGEALKRKKIKTK